jgi:hypothetical protein
MLSMQHHLGTHRYIHKAYTNLHYACPQEPPASSSCTAPKVAIPPQQRYHLLPSRTSPMLWNVPHRIWVFANWFVSKLAPEQTTVYIAHSGSGHTAPPGRLLVLCVLPYSTHQTSKLAGARCNLRRMQLAATSRNLVYVSLHAAHN